MVEQSEVRETYHDRVRTEVLSLVPDGCRSVLDVGGGTGHSAAFLKRTKGVEHAVVADLVGDNCLPEIDAAYGGNLEDPAVLGRIADEQGRFDAILCLDVLEHLSDPWSVVAQAHRMLNPGGVLLASIPNMRHYSLVCPLFFLGRFDLQDAGILDRTHLRWFVRDTAVSLLTSSGLQLQHIEGKYYGRRDKLADIASFGLLRGFLYKQYFIRVGMPAGAEPSERFLNQSKSA